MLNTQSSAEAAKKLSHGQLVIRINGILPNIATLGDVEDQKEQKK